MSYLIGWSDLKIEELKVGDILVHNFNKQKALWENVHYMSRPYVVEHIYKFTVTLCDTQSGIRFDWPRAALGAFTLWREP